MQTYAIVRAQLKLLKRGIFDKDIVLVKPCFVVTMRLQYKNIQVFSKVNYMRLTDTYVRARIDTVTKKRAADALEAMGLSISDAIRLLMLRVADEHRLPFEVKVPNSITRRAITELETGKGKKFKRIDAFMEDLNADN